MPSRPAIPASIERQLMIDAGWRCSIPTCGTTTALEIDHIEEWSEVKDHRYENLIVLCPTHHAMKQKGSRPRELNATALKIVKQNQVELSGRYGDVERRVLEYFVRRPGETIVFLPGDFDVLLMQLLDAGLLDKQFNAEGSIVMGFGEDGAEPTPDSAYTVRQAYRLTDEGASAVSALREARSLHSAIQ
ncbi:HNH endonuclease signature motif containing protein [Leifsonia xyli]|uniref:HNH endonuclease signature motif containing protein n=1 Tax=Leifsonia xyli TaxID=1575 RepID=UPI003D676A29